MLLSLLFKDVFFLRLNDMSSSAFLFIEDGQASSNSGNWGLSYWTQLKNCKTRKMLLLHSNACIHWKLWNRYWTNIFREKIEVEIPGGEIEFVLYYQIIAMDDIH